MHTGWCGLRATHLLGFMSRRAGLQNRSSVCVWSSAQGVAFRAGSSLHALPCRTPVQRELLTAAMLVVLLLVLRPVPFRSSSRPQDCGACTDVDGAGCWIHPSRSSSSPSYLRSSWNAQSFWDFTWRCSRRANRAARLALSALPSSPRGSTFDCILGTTHSCPWLTAQYFRLWRRSPSLGLGSDLFLIWIRSEVRLGGGLLPISQDILLIKHGLQQRPVFFGEKRLLCASKSWSPPLIGCVFGVSSCLPTPLYEAVLGCRACTGNVDIGCIATIISRGSMSGGTRDMVPPGDCQRPSTPRCVEASLVRDMVGSHLHSGLTAALMLGLSHHWSAQFSRLGLWLLRGDVSLACGAFR